MKEQAEKNLQSISLEDAILKIKELNPGEYDKMIIDKNQTLQRCNYLLLNYSALSADRQGKKIVFPMYSPILNNFSEFEGGDSKHGELAYFPTDKILSNLKNNFSIEPELDPVSTAGDFDFPFDTDGDNISTNQRFYFIADRTYKEQCDECSGNKLVKCDNFECDGRHIWTCTECNGEGRLVCNTCGGSKKIMCGTCGGNDRVKCSKCGGDGKVNDSIAAKAANSKYFQEKKCGSCQGRGWRPCSDCTRGRVVCNNCSGQGKVVCSTCQGNKKITCPNCYGDKERLGMIDCPQCKAQGEMGYLAYVETSIRPVSTEKLFPMESPLNEISENEIISSSKANPAPSITVRNFNENHSIERNDHILKYSEQICNEFDLHIDSYPKLVEEKIAYSIIPCIQIEYTHMLTNQNHEISIINFFENPELKFHQAAETVKKDVKDTTKKVGRFFGKLLKTKSFKAKDDRKKEIRLMIYLAKADGIIEEEEKLFLSEHINSIDEFTSSEKTEFFDLMNSPKLPDLTKEDVTFSSEEKFQEVVDTLMKLASSDGNIEESEKDLIDRIKSLA